MVNNPGHQAFGDFAPAAADFTDRVLFGEVWERPQLNSRDRSLITITNLVSQYRINELGFHIKKGIENGLSKEEIIEVITHLAFYAGWPAAMSALNIAKNVFKDLDI
ncbi:4-carboxymuconolactone decarboxylase [Acinetobacter proteolyticus]|uniref:4-carboxymuconolactone decarboxylase n=1 Tax=Acinetobacter proteolyticus TaxID=1776741 RepID=A0A653KDE8_9GAMM|nr:carboxymuconolactone decarboxylase family protein [Acinetobacter proteolyticus]VXA58116.1 4-carboxymuconolactone decarboxylase [Acinetobacter proteolyticus]